MNIFKVPPKYLILVIAALELSLTAGEPEIEFLFSIPHQEGEFNATSGGMVVRNQGVFLHGRHALYFSESLPTRFEELNRVALPSDFNALESVAVPGSDRLYFRLMPLLNENGTAVNLGYVYSVTDDGVSTLTDVSTDFYFASEWIDPADGSTILEEWLRMPNQVRRFGENWIAHFSGSYYAYALLSPEDNSFEWIDGAEALTERSGGGAYGPGDFALIDNVLATGGELAVLDVIEIYRAEISDDSKRFLEPEGSVTRPSVYENDYFRIVGDEEFYSYINGIQNRDLRVWHAEPRTQTFFAAGEGVIIRSTDLAESFQFVQKYDDAYPVSVPPQDVAEFPDGRYYPYHDFIATSGRYPRQVLVAGSDKLSSALYLGLSSDNGDSWENHRSLIAEYGEVPVFLEQVADGIFYLGLTRRSDETLNVLRVTLPDPLRERFPSASYHAEGQSWWSEPSLGRLYGAHYPWVWLEDQEVWLWTEPGGSGGGWMWDEQLGWLWVWSDVLPWLHSEAEESWLMYLPGSASPRWFWNARQAHWQGIAR